MTDLFGGALDQEGPRPMTHACTGDGCLTCRVIARIPATPYAGTSGWSGSDTSRERALNADASGVTSLRQQQALTYLEGVGAVGTTWKELSNATGWHHGTSSGTLSVLHKEGMIVRLAQVRDRCKVYVLPIYVNGRRTEAQGRPKDLHQCPSCGHTF